MIRLPSLPRIPQLIPIILFFIMFIYSGTSKIFNYNQKLQGLDKHTGGYLPNIMLHLGISGVILLEIIGSLLIIAYFAGILTSKVIARFVLYLFLMFLIVVTALYHPPTDKMIPFLSNVTTFSGLILIYNLI